jgi:superfamily II DNA or RNA helicase
VSSWPGKDDPWAHQVEAYERTREAYRAGARAVVVALATGGGKTTVGAAFVLGAQRKGHPVVWAAHREELLDQARNRLLQEGVPRVGIVAGDRPTMNAPVQVCSLATLAKRKARGLPPAKVLILDEAHHGEAETYREIIDHYQAQGCAILGLTATPERGDKRPLGKRSGGIFDAMVQVSSVRKLQAAGILVPCETYRPMSRQKDLSMDPVAAHMSRTPGERTFVFARDVAHAEALVLAFRAQGIEAAAIHAKTRWDLREALLDAFKQADRAPLLRVGYMRPWPLVLVNVYTLTEGVDVPSATHCIIARGYGHWGMGMQMIGRVLRADKPSGKVRCVVSDLCGATWDFGLPEADQVFHIEGERAREVTREERERPAVTCSACQATATSWACDREGWRICATCQARIAAPDPVVVKPKRQELFGQTATPEQRERHLMRLARNAALKGWKAGAIAMQYKSLFGDFPPWGASDRALQEARANISDHEREREARRVAKLAELKAQEAQRADPEAAWQAYLAEQARCG